MIRGIAPLRNMKSWRAALAACLFSISALAQTPPVPLGPSGSGGGGGGGGGTGTVTAVTTACAVSSSPSTITTTGVIQGTVPLESQTGTSSTPAAATECGATISYSNASAIAVSLVAANWTTTSNFFNFKVLSTSVGAVTFTPTTGTIDGAASETFQPRQTGTIWFDGANWNTTGVKVVGPSSSTTGHLATYADASGDNLLDSGVPASSVITNNYLGLPAYITGASMWYANPLTTGAAPQTGTTGAANSYYCVPFWNRQTATVKGMAIRVITTSTGNTSAALQGAFYNDLVTTGSVHRPGTFIDYTTNFATGSAATVTATLNNTTDSLPGPGIIWGCVQKFDAVAAFQAVSAATGTLVGAAIGSATPGNLTGSVGNLNGVTTTGSAYGTTNWVSFNSSTSWTEGAGSIVGPVVLIEIN